MRVVRIAASCIGLLTTFGTLTSMAADVSTPFIQQEAARADASLRQRAEAPMTGAASLRSESAYVGLSSAPMKALPKEAIAFPIDHIVITSSEPVFRKYKNRLEAYEHNRIGSGYIPSKAITRTIISRWICNKPSGCTQSRFTFRVINF